MRNLKTIVIHHSVTPRDLTLEKSVSSFSRSHSKRLHPRVNSEGTHIAYHYVVAGSGRFQKTRGLHEVGYHASNYYINSTSVGICMTGNFDINHPTSNQLHSVNYIISELEKKFGKLEIRFHNEFARKSCPGKNVTKDMFKKKQRTGDQLLAVGVAKDYLGSVRDKVEEMRDVTNARVKKAKDLGLAQ